MNGLTAHHPGDSVDRRLPRLLLAEDDSSTLELLCEVLRPHYDLEATTDGDEALAAARRAPPDLVLSDVLMPRLDGISLTRRLRAEPRLATVPIILLTAHTEEALLLEGLQAGADDFLPKPFSPVGLLARLKSHRQLIDLRRQAATRQTEERYRLIVESAQDYAIFTYDSQRRVTNWNSGAQAMTGFTPDDIIGQPVDLLYSPEDRENGVPAQECRVAHETGRFDNERWHMKKDGSRFWGSGVVMPLREGGPEPGCLKILRDLTGVHQAETARHQAEDRFSLVVQSIQDYAIYLLDPEGRVTTWNRGAEFIKGYTEEEIIGQSFTVCFTPEDIAAGLPERELAATTRDGRFHEEGWRMRKGGERYWGDELIVCLRGANGEVTAYAKFCRDLTERKRQEDERAGLLASEQAARQEAEAANQSKDRFLAALSHELRTPLAPVSLALFLMGREKNLPAIVQEGIETIRRCVDTEIQLIGDLLDVSRIVHGKLELDLKPVDLHDCIRQAMEVCREDFDAKQIELSVALEARRSWVRGDGARLQQVFWNLLKNAAKFTPDGGRVSVGTRDTDGRITVAVVDSGLGISAEAMTKIFDPFEQGDPDRTRVYGGLGLGLAISHAIVAAHGGDLAVESPGNGQGSTFHVQLSTTPD